MADLLIRNVPDEVIEAIDAKAKKVGLSRSEYLRRTLDRERTTGRMPVTASDLRSFAQLASDLDDPDVMNDAWS